MDFDRLCSILPLIFASWCQKELTNYHLQELFIIFWAKVRMLITLAHMR